jgi:Ca-activated chloride channel family protein
LEDQEVALGGLVEGGVNRVLLLTDGLANVGITDPGQLRDLVASAAAKGVSTTTIGFGADYDERLLRSLADAGQGNTYYIEEPDQAPAIFEAEIEGLMALAAQNVTVSVTPSAAVLNVTVLHQYPSRQTDDGSLCLELGDLYALEPKSVLLQFLLSGDGDTAEADVATVTIDGYVLLANGGVERKTVTLPIHVQRSGAAVVNPQVRRELLILEAARAREEALRDRARGEFHEGASKLRHVTETLAAHADSDDEIRDEVEDLRDLAERFDEEQVTARDAKWMYQRAYSSAQSKRATLERIAMDRAREREERRKD